MKEEIQEYRVGVRVWELNRICGQQENILQKKRKLTMFIVFQGRRCAVVRMQLLVKAWDLE